jgi:16S rRNA (cytidine1402-2'-O)-methyltransferase
LRDLAESGAGQRQAVVAREMTKQYEEFRRGTVAELAEYYENSPPRGEVVLIVAAGEQAPPAEELLRKHVVRLRAEGASRREIVRLLVEEYRAARNVAYRIAHE